MPEDFKSTIDDIAAAGFRQFGEFTYDFTGIFDQSTDNEIVLHLKLGEYLGNYYVNGLILA